MSITPTVMQCWGWAMWRWREKIIPPPNVIISRPCVWTAATLTPCAGWQIFTASNRQKKAEAFIASLSASQRRSIDDIERSLQNDRLAQQAEALENPGGKWAQAAALQRQRLALDPGSVWITYRLSQDLWQAGQRSRADTLMRNLAQQKSNDPEQVYAYGLYLSGHDPRTERRWRISTACRVRSGTAIFRSWLIDCKAIRCWKPLTACEKAAKRQKRKRCCASNHLPRVLT